MSERITINRLRNTLKAVQKLTQNSDLTIQHWNGKFFLYENGRQISDQYNSKKEIWNYLRGYLQIKPIERGVKK